MKAIDFMKKLEQDPKYKEMQKGKDEETKNKIAELKIITAPFIEELNNNGFTEIKVPSDLVQLKKVDRKLSELLLKWIPKIDNKYCSQEMFIRALAKADQPFDGRLLIDLFENKEYSSSFKWAIANTIASAKVENILEWLQKKLASSDQPIENEMLVYAAIKYFDRDKSRFFLRTLFEKHPLQVADALTYVGNNDDIIFLEEKRNNLQGVQQTQIDKAIKKLKKKLGSVSD
jgi:hypothetical protein